MFSATIKQFVPRGTLFFAAQYRAIGTSLVLNAVKATKAPKSIDSEAVKVKKLQQNLKREKQVLAKLKLQNKLKTESQKARESKRKAAVAEKTLIAKAIKKVRKLTAFNIFVRERSTATKKPLDQVVGEWAILSESEKAVYQDKANVFNEEKLKVYKPKPTAPANAYANFLKDKWAATGVPFIEASKALSAEWKTLSDAEKLAYAPTDAEKEEYSRKYTAWKTERIDLYKEAK